MRHQVLVSWNCEPTSLLFLKGKRKSKHNENIVPTSSFLKCADSLSASKKHRSAHSSDLRNTMVTREARGCSGAKAPPPPRALWVTSFHWSDPVGARPLRTPNDKAFLAHSAFFHMDLCANTCLGMCANTCLGMCANLYASAHLSV